MFLTFKNLSRPVLQGKYAPEQVRSPRLQVVPDVFFLDGDHGEHAVHRFSGDVIVEVRIDVLGQRKRVVFGDDVRPDFIGAHTAKRL